MATFCVSYVVSLMMRRAHPAEVSRVEASSSPAITAPISSSARCSSGIYYLATAVYPHRYTDNPAGEWQVKIFVSDNPDGDFRPVEGNPVMAGQRACLFQHIFHGRFYGYDCHLDSPDHWIMEEVEAPLP